MPKTPLDQNCRPPLGQHNIRRAGQPPVVQTEAQAARVEGTAKGDFWARVFAPNAGHHAGAGCWINDINHAYPLAPFSRPGKADA